MPINIPFSRPTFPTECKPKLSGVNITLDYNNVESPLMKKAVDMQKLIGSKLYKKLIDEYKTPSTNENSPYPSALDYLQRAMLHFAVYEHLIFMIVKIGNDGVTVKKNDSETTLYKYQQDELSNTLINNAWFWAGVLLDYLEENAESISEWKDSDAQKAIKSLPVTKTHFEKWVGIDNSYFIAKVQWITQEVYTDIIKPRGLSVELLTKLDSEISRAVVYEVMNRACLRLSYADLPENIRKDINNEYNKKSSDQSDTYIRKTVSLQFSTQAEKYINALDMAIKCENKADISAQPVYQNPYTERDAFIVT
jgi:hypothetical protein